MIWVLALLASVPLTILLGSLFRKGRSATDDTGFPSQSPAQGRAFLDIEGVEAEPVWGTWLRVRGFDPAEDRLFIEVPPGDTLRLSYVAMSETGTYLMLSNGTKIFLEGVTELPCAAHELIYVLPE